MYVDMLEQNDGIFNVSIKLFFLVATNMYVNKFSHNKKNIGSGLDIKH